MGTQSTLEDRFGKCPYATAQTLISGKWAVLILLYLEEGPIRFNELLRKMPKMTPTKPRCLRNLRARISVNIRAVMPCAPARYAPTMTAPSLWMAIARWTAI